jgi:hypothetical protein
MVGYLLSKKSIFLKGKIPKFNQDSLLKCSYRKYLLFNFKYLRMNIHVHYDVSICISVKKSLICTPNLFHVYFEFPLSNFKICFFFSPKQKKKLVWKANNDYIITRPVRIRVRIDPPQPLVCRKRWLNGAVLRMRPGKPRSRVTAGVAR